MIFKKATYFFIIFTGLLMAGLTSTAQFYNDGAVLALKENSQLYVGANYIQQAGEVVNEGTIALAANWVNNSKKNVFKDNMPGTVALVGKDQILGGTEPTQFDALILAETGIKTLENNQYVVGSLALGNSELATDDYIMHLENPAQKSLSRSEGFISSAKNGGFRRNTSLSLDYVFPLGFKSDGQVYYRPLVIKPNTPTDNAYTAAIYPNINTIDNFTPASISGTDVEELNQDYYYKLNRDNGDAPITLNVYYASGIDGSYNTLLNWDKQNAKLDQMTTVQERLAIDVFDEKLSTRYWKDFNNEYYLMARRSIAMAEPFAMEIPNVISPNNDGKNDSWQIPSFNGFVENEVYVYNRWGSEVYQKKNYSNQDAWYAENVNAGTYFYRIIINPKSANPEVKHGYLTIIK